MKRPSPFWWGSFFVSALNLFIKNTRKTTKFFAKNARLKLVYILLLGHDVAIILSSYFSFFFTFYLT
jgi:hypothetical protein|tara:strand:+ start:535647 stop:535847 length:201 start_codon:yes stop_codon:yes gene_type:complete